MPTTPKLHVAGDASQLQALLALLLEAYDCALELGRSVWDLAVEIGTLEAAGLGRSQLRWLLLQGLAEHAEEVASTRKNCRRFQHTGRFPFTAATCVVLTESGARFARQASQGAHARHAQDRGMHQGARDTLATVIPCWDRHARELYYAGLLVKRFTVAAPNQELVLTSLDELGWPWHLDDPLPPAEGLDPSRRLHDTISRLNRGQVHQLIHFRGDGLGRGLYWEPIEGTATGSPPGRHHLATRSPPPRV